MVGAPDNKRIGDGSNVRLEGARRQPSASFELPKGTAASAQVPEAPSVSGGLQSLGQKLGELRRGKGMTQIAVASKMGTTQPSLARLEKNELNPNLKTLSRYASAIDLDVKVSYIQQGKDGKAGVAGVSDLEGVPVKLAQLRKDSGMTQSAVADRMNNTQPVVARLESGEIAPNLRTLERYAEAMDMRIELSFDDMKKAS